MRYDTIQYNTIIVIKCLIKCCVGSCWVGCMITSTEGRIVHYTRETRASGRTG